MTVVFDRVAHRYTRAQALADGVLVDLTEWASADTDAGMVFGFVCPVAVTAAVWKEINAMPLRLEGIADVRGRAYDMLWMAAMAAREGGGREATFTVQMGVGRSKWQQYRVVMSPDGPGGEGCGAVLDAAMRQERY